MREQYRINGRTASAIADSIEQGVRDGGLEPGALLPPVRSLADELGDAANTAASAYRALRQRGVIETDGRRGTRVRPRPPAQPRSALRLAVPPGATDLSHGEPDPAHLPNLARALRGLDGGPVGYSRTGVLPELAEIGRSRLAADGLPVTELTVTSGALDGIERCLLAHTGPGDRVAVEDPGWANLLDLIAALGLDPVPVGVDDDGIVPGDLKRALHQGVRAVLLTTRAHNPTGAAITAARAAELRTVLAAHPDTLLLEDDHAADLTSEALHTLAGATTHWASIRSASKPYGPDLRLGLLAGDETTVSRVKGRQRLGAGWVSHVLQRIVASLWTDEEVTAVVERAGAAYAERRDGLRAALRARGIESTGRTGLNVWIPTEDETTALVALRDRGWVVAPGARFRLRSAPGVRVTISQLPVERIEPLADAIAAALRPTGGGYGV